ncbi:efflux RND transporter permease subunit [Acetobacter sp.]|uniref:efflux RND transporter permease subunit n=1 Tax=Acetobacter sp. TaxID=440 RepID=UPI0039EA11F7
MMERFNLSRWAVHHPALIGFLMVTLFLAGGYEFNHLGRAEDPAFTLKNMIVSAQWPGASAEQMQKQIAAPLEQGLRNVEAIDTLSTYCIASACVTQIFLKDDELKERVPAIWQQIRNKVSDIAPDLPPNAVLAANDDYADVYGYVFTLTGSENATLVKTAEALQKTFQRIHDVGKVQIIGAMPQQIHVDVDPQQLSTTGLSIDQISQALRQRTGLAQAGVVDFTTEIPLSVSGTLDGVSSIENAPVRGQPGIVRVREIAEVGRDYSDPPPSLVRYGGKPAVVIAVAMTQGGDGLTLGKSLRQAAAQAAAELPAGMKLTQVEDQSLVIQEAVNTFLIKFLVALTVVLLVAFVSLGWRAGIIVALSVPLTLSGVALYMGAKNIGLDRISLGALILSLGLLVDDAIISIEAMVVQLELGRSREEAASYAWTHTAFPMLTGTLLTVVSFLPIGLANSTTGEYAGEIFWVSGAALLFSWIVAVVFIPFLGMHLLPEPKRAMPEDTPSPTPRHKLSEKFQNILHETLHHNRLVVGITLLLVAMAAGGMFLVDQQFFPQSDRPELLVDVAMEPGTAIGRTSAVVSRLEHQLTGQKSLRHMEAHIGDGAPRFYLPYGPATPSSAHATLLLVAQNIHAREELIGKINAITLPVGVHLNIQRLSLGPTADFPVQYRIIGSDPERLRSIARDVEAVLRDTNGAIAVQSDWGNRTPTLTFDADPDRLATFQTDRTNVASQLQSALSGEIAGDIPDGHRHTAIIVRANAAFRSDPGRWTDIPVNTGAGVVPLGQLGAIRTTSAFPILWQRNGELCMTVQSNVENGIQPSRIVQVAASGIATIQTHLPAGYRIEIGGDEELSSTADNAIFSLLPLTGAVVLLLLMVQLQSLSRSLLVIFSALLGLVGSVGALLVSGAPFGFVALLGLIALAGMIMRNTILLVDQIQQNHRAGMLSEDAVIHATMTRARPVILTAISAMLAFIPLSFNVFWGPMAITMIGGLAGGTLLTLIALPAFYTLLFTQANNQPGNSLHA